MSQWFRVYSDLTDDPKVQRLPADLFKMIINLWCLTAQNEGVLPAVDVIAFKLRLKPERVSKMMDDLRKADLLDDDETGTHPHNWNGRQFKSDGNTTERVKRFRERKRNVSPNVTCNESETPPETEQKQNRTDLSIASQSQGGRTATRPAVDAAFAEFWKAYPKRDGANPRAPAAKKFAAALKAGSSVDEIVAGARAYRTECDKRQLTGTPMVAQCVTWLNQSRWTDYAPAAEPKARDDPPPTAEQLEARRKLIEIGDRMLNGTGNRNPESGDPGLVQPGDRPWPAQ